jgi:hypothetical protein
LAGPTRAGITSAAAAAAGPAVTGNSAAGAAIVIVHALKYVAPGAASAALGATRAGLTCRASRARHAVHVDYLLDGAASASAADAVAAFPAGAALWEWVDA